MTTAEIKNKLKLAKEELAKLNAHPKANSIPTQNFQYYARLIKKYEKMLASTKDSVKKYKVGKYIVTADSPLEAVKVVKLIDSQLNDEASQLQTVNALIEDEKAAVEAYDVAIENLCGKIPEESLQAIIAIRDDENRHIENLQAVVNDTVTEKNLEDKDSTVNDMGMWVPSKKRNYNDYNMSLSPDKLEIKLKAGMSGNVDRTIIEGAIREIIGDFKEVMSNKSLDQSGVDNVKQVYRELAKRYQGKLYSTNANEALDDLLRLVR